MASERIPDPVLMTRLQLSVKGVDWAASLVRARQHEAVMGEWTPHQHLYYLLGMEGVLQERIRRLAGEDSPVFADWDEDAYMASHAGDGMDISELAEQFMAARAQTVELLKPLPEDAWFKTATWPDGREIDMAWLAERCLWHALDRFAYFLRVHGESEPLQAPAWRGGAAG